MPNYKISLQNQQITLKDALIDTPKKPLNIDNITRVLVGIVVGATFATLVAKCEEVKPQSLPEIKCINCHSVYKEKIKAANKRAAKYMESLKHQRAILAELETAL